MTQVFERELADQALQRAKHKLADLENRDDAGALPLVVGIAVDCVEALVRQIRDADDTQATTLEPKITAGLNDLAVAVGGIGGDIAAALPSKR